MGRGAARLPLRSWTGALCGALLVGQLAFLLANSASIYGHFALTTDFATYYQAFFQLAHGHLDPIDTINGVPFVRSHFELIMWPLSALYWLFPRPLGLLVLGDVAMVLAEVVALLWVIDVLRARAPRPALPDAALLAGFLAMVLVNPWFYEAASFDFHTEAFSVLFALLVARDLYNRRHRRALVWLALLLACGDVGGVYAVGLGLGMLLADRRRWRLGLSVLGGGVAWVLALSYAHYNAGSSLSDYQQLTGKVGAAAFTITAGDVITQTLAHPERLWHLVAQRWTTVLRNLVPSGLVGVLSPWVAGVFLVTVLTTIGQDYPAFVQPGFQNLVLYLFVPVGTIMVIAWMDRPGPATGASPAHASGPGSRGTWTPRSVMAAAVAGVSMGSAVAFSLVHLPGLLPVVPEVPGATRAALLQALDATPPDAEVVASYGVIGRFSGRRSVYYLGPSPTPTVLPVSAPLIEFVVVPAYGFTVSPQAAQADIAQLEQRYGARVVQDHDGVTVLRWSPPPGTHAIPFGAR